MKLSDELIQASTSKPDEWTMCAFARRARELEDALLDARSGMKYIRDVHGPLYGVGFERVEEKCKKALGEPDAKIF